MSGFEHQTHFLGKIKETLGDQTVPVLGDVLSLSADSVYRRLRGQSVLALDEAIKICQHLKMPLSQLESAMDGNVYFSYPPIATGKKGFEQYITGVVHTLRNASSIPDTHLTYAAETIPIMHHFRFPHLGPFKMFYWMRSLMNVEDYQDRPFEVEAIPGYMREMAREAAELYIRIPSTEIWTDLSLMATVRQLEFFWDTGLIKSKELALTICNEIEALFDNLRTFAENGEKRSVYSNHSAPFTLYQCDLVIGNNSVVVETHGQKMVFESFQTFRIMATRDKHFVDSTELWINNILQKSTLISGAAERNRHRFFSALKARLNVARDFIENS